MRPRYLYASETCAGSNGDPDRHYYVNALTSSGLAAWASNIVSRLTLLNSTDSRVDGIIIHNHGGLNGSLQQVEGIAADPDASTGSAAMTAALQTIRDGCNSLGMSRGLIIYTGPGVVGGDHATVYGPINIGVPIIVDGAGIASAQLLSEYDTAAGQTVGIEAMADKNISPASAVARFSETICGSSSAPWNPDTYSGGLNGSLRPSDFYPLNQYTGELISLDTFASTTADIRRRARICWNLQMSVESPIYNFESGAITRTLFADHPKSASAAQLLLT